MTEIRESVPAKEADALAAKGARVLERRTLPEGGVVCDVEIQGGQAVPSAPAEEAPKRKPGRPKRVQADGEGR